ncbi:MAG: hypothetical protein EXR99_10645 [Gemmataceae bacterium]|nr:hypothetical protein [Gemmataceae bacterium]
MFSFVLAIGLSNSLVGAECAGGVCNASVKTASASCGSCGSSKGGFAGLLRRGRGETAVAPAAKPVETKLSEKKPVEKKDAQASETPASGRLRGVLSSFRR